MKELIAIFLIGFWLSYPVGLMYLNIGDYERLDTSNYLDEINQDEPTLLDSATTFWSGIKIYFKIMYLSLPNIPSYMSFLVVILQLISVLFIIIMFRGN